MFRHQWPSEFDNLKLPIPSLFFKRERERRDKLVRNRQKCRLISTPRILDWIISTRTGYVGGIRWWRVIADSAAKAFGRLGETRRDETSPLFNENVSEHRRSTPARNDKWNFQIALSRADCRRDRIMQRLEIIGPPPHRAEPPVPVIRHFEFHSAAIGNPRHFSPLVSESFEWSRLIIYDVLRLQCDIHSFERVYEAKIDIKKRKSIDWFIC